MFFSTEICFCFVITVPSPRTLRRSVDYKMVEQDFSVPSRSYVDHLTTFSMYLLPLHCIMVPLCHGFLFNFKWILTWLPLDTCHNILSYQCSLIHFYWCIGKFVCVQLFSLICFQLIGDYILSGFTHNLRPVLTTK